MFFSPMKKKLVILLFLIGILGFGKQEIFAQSPPTSVGQCHATQMVGQTIEGVNINWGYPSIYWANVERTKGTYDWSALDGAVRSVNGKIWIQVSTSNPGVPVIPSWATDVSQLSDGYWFYGNYNRSKPAQWDPDYKRHLRELVNAMAAKYDNDNGDNAKIEAVLVMAGGNYGEMGQTVRCCHGAHAAALAQPTPTPGDPCLTRLDDVHDPNSDFIRTMRDAHPTETTTSLISPYTDPVTGVNYVAKFDYYYVQNTLELIDIYAQAFQNKAIVVQLGSGVSCQFIVASEVARQAVAKYCNRVWLKQNGWGTRVVDDYPYYTLFNDYKDKTRTVLEVGDVNPWKNNPTHNSDHVTAAINKGVSAVCFQGEILGNTNLFSIPYLSLQRGLVANYQNWFSHAPACNPVENCLGGEVGNLNCDAAGKIDGSDLNVMFNSWLPSGPVPTPPAGHHTADLNGDNFVNEKDAIILLTHWNP